MPIVYPPSLPPPVSITDEPLERRRAYGRPGPWAVAAWGRERTGTVDLQWVLTPAEAQAWRTWFEDPVDDGGIAMGGAWWSATWPSVRGPAVEIAYQFLTEPRWEHAGRGIWRVSAQAQRRGGVAMPTADNAASAPPPPPPPPPPPAAPVANFSASPLSGPAPLLVNFTNLTTGAGPIAYQWDFTNDGAFDSSAQNPSYTYNVPGTYAVRLQATNAQGSDVETKTGYITVTDSDPFYAFSVLRLHFDGANGSTTIPDTSPTPASVTSFGGAALSTARARFGPSSGFFDGVNDYLGIARNQSIGSGLFTISAQIRPASAQTGRIVSSQSAFTPNPVIALRVDANGALTFLLRDINGGGLLVLTSNPGLVAMNDTAWHHVAATRNSANRIDIWLNGVSVANATSATSPAGAPGYVVGSFGGNQEWFHGYIDEVDVLQGACRYTGPFTPPSGPYPDL